MDDLKDVLQRYLDRERRALLWQLDGLSERDQRWPATATGTNLLGLVKHVAFTQACYLGDVFGRPLPDKPAWMLAADDEDSEANLDMWASSEESPAEIVALYERVNAHADATIGGFNIIGICAQLFGSQLGNSAHGILAGAAARFADAPHSCATPRGSADGIFRIAQVDLDGAYRQAERFGQDHGDHRARAGADVLAGQEDFYASVRVYLERAGGVVRPAAPGMERHAKSGHDRATGRAASVRRICLRTRRSRRRRR